VRPAGYAYDRNILAGLFILLGIFVIGLFSMKLTDSPVFRSGTEYKVILNDATGINRNSRVKIAGISVGVVKNIQLIQGKAELTLLLDKGNKVERGSYILPRSQGILGDRFIEIVLPQNQEETEIIKKEGAREIEPNTKTTSSSLWLEKLLSSLLPIAQAQTNNYQEGEIIPAKPGASSTDDVMRKLGDIGDDVKILAKDLREIVHNNKGDIQGAIKAIKSSAERLDLLLGDLSAKDTRTDLKEAIRGMRESVQSIRDVAQKINNGEGSIGKLINDPQVADQLVRALNSINEYLDKTRRTEFIVDMNTNYLTGMSESKSYFGLRILPRSSYGYHFGIVQDPGGRVTKTETTTTTGGGAPVVVKEKKVEKSAFKFNFQFLRRIYATTFRLGLFESTGGLAIDQELWKDHLSLTAEVFDFGRDQDNAHLRVFAKFQFLDTFYIQGGIDDAAAKSSKRAKDSVFVGVGLRFTDNDLKSILLLLGGP
jgi:phospholipid/cholesterol/gamma-HCH transport system substrate-binding protein